MALIRSSSHLLSCWIPILVLTIHATVLLSQAWTPIVVKNVMQLGPQLTPDVTNVSRDGGHSVLINGNIVWLFDDTECMGFAGDQLSFISNTAAYANKPHKDMSTVKDFGVVMVGKDSEGRKQYAILADKTVGTGGWIPFLQDELDFNNKNADGQRVAIWPGTSPTPISITEAFIFAPLVYVDSKPRDPSKKYQGRGMTLVTITAPKSGPLATRQGGLIIPGTQVPFGGFASLLGFPSTEFTTNSPSTDRDVYLLGMTDAGLQLSRVDVNDINDLSKYSYFQPQYLNFSTNSPDPKINDYRAIYLPGTFTSGTTFYSPYFCTFVMVYFNKMVDSTFYIRFLDLERKLGDSATWIDGGKDGNGICAEDTEALVWYGWSPEQTLYVSPTGKGGFNYAGAAHPEYFNRRYYAPSLYADGMSISGRQNDWYGASILDEADAGGDGRHLLLSWTSQIQGGFDTGLYELQLTKVEFDDIPPRPSSTGSATAPSSPGNPSATTTDGGKPAKPSNCGTRCLGYKSDGTNRRPLFGSDSREGSRLWAIAGALGLLAGVVNSIELLLP